MSYPILLPSDAGGTHIYNSAGEITGWNAAPDPYFRQLGIGMLTDAESCKVTESLNGEIEFTMVYPVEGVHYADITYESIITVKLPDRTNPQAFRVYSISKPINKKITVNAEHISYRLAEIPVKPFHGTGGINWVLTAFTYGSGNNQDAIYPHPFTFHTDFPNVLTHTFDLATPQSIRYCMGDNDKMMLDKDTHKEWKDGEWKFDNFNIYFLQNRGTDKTKTVKYTYGDNISDFTEDLDTTSTITGVFPYWHAEDSDGQPFDVLGSICYADGHQGFKNERIQPVDVDEFFTQEEKDDWNETTASDGKSKIKIPTQAQVNSKAEKALLDFDYVCKPQITLTFTPVDVRKYSGYEDFADALEECYIGDKITIYFREYNINATKEVIGITYNVLTDTVEQLTVGDPKTALAATIAQIGQIVEANRAGIIINKDSILLYVNRANGRIGSQIYMDDSEIRSTVAGYHDDWNMVPITGSTTIGGEAWTIHLYNYGTPTAVNTHIWDNDTQDWVYSNKYDNSLGVYNGMNYFDQETGAVWEARSNGWYHKKWTKNHGNVGSGSSLPTASYDNYQKSFLLTTTGVIYICERSENGTDVNTSTNITKPGTVTYNSTTDSATKAANSSTALVTTQVVYSYYWAVKDQQNIQLSGRDAYAEKADYYTQSVVKQTESSWEARVNSTNGKLAELAITLDGISQTVSSNNGALESSINVQSGRITSEVTDRTNADATLSSRITQTAESITAEVSRATTAEGNLSSRIQMLPESIEIGLTNDLVGKDAGPYISLSWVDGNGTRHNTTPTGQIKLNGSVVFRSQLVDGTTMINGANIMTGSITADKIEAGAVSAYEVETKYDEDNTWIQMTQGRIVFYNDIDPIGPIATDYTYASFIGVLNREDELARHVNSNFTKWQQEMYTDDGDLYAGGMYVNPPRATGKTRIHVYSIYGTSIRDTAVADVSDLDTESSARYKYDIADLNIEDNPQLDPHNLYDLHVKQFHYNELSNVTEETDSKYRELAIGFIAEEVESIYPRAVQLDEYKRPNAWKSKYIIPPMLYLIQEQHKEIESLKKEVADLKEMVNDILIILQNENK